MKLFRYLMPMVVAAGLTSAAAYADDNSKQQDSFAFSEELNQRDSVPLRDFIKTKRTIDVQEKSGNLTLSGDVRTEWRHLTEKNKFGNEMRGNTSGYQHYIDYLEENMDGTYNRALPVSKNDFDIEFNFMVDYVCDRAWAVAHINFDNSAGVDGSDMFVNGFSDPLITNDPQGLFGSGQRNRLNLRKAYFGYNVWCEGGSRFDVEVGRRQLYQIIESEIQYLSRFDGILLKYSDTWECSDWWYKLGGFVVDERVNHFAWVTELALLNTMNLGLDLKYSFIDWRKNGVNRALYQDPAGSHFMNSQFTFAYHLDTEWTSCEPIELYGAFIWNHTPVSNVDKFPKFYKDNVNTSAKQNIAWYLGLLYGEVISEGDYSLEARYEYVQAHSIPDTDVSGIGRGNVADESFTASGCGNANYKGWHFEALYALTDNLSIDMILEFSSEIDSNIGGRTVGGRVVDDTTVDGVFHKGPHSYSKFEVEAVYAF